MLLRTYKSFLGAPEFLDLNINQLKGKLQGCMSALSGDCSARLSLNFYNADVGDWEHCVEPFDVALSIDQMPNELVSQSCSISSSHGRSLTPLCATFLGIEGCVRTSGVHEPYWHSVERLRRDDV